MKKHAVILLMAGSSHRFEGAKPKQFLDLHGQPLYRHSLNRFIECGFDQIYLVCPKSHISKIEDPFNIVEGGNTRQESVLNGLKALPSDIELVTIHDAARALVSHDLIQNHKKSAQSHYAITTVVPVNDTIYQINKQALSATFNRESLKIGQTPQTFNRQLLEKAHREFIGQATDDAMMVHKLGQAIHLIEGDPNNFKITYAKDLALARLILDQKTT
jgi:2-C-methyl-D-erythritol 4-phosphate cytidylyltransferase